MTDTMHPLLGGYLNEPPHGGSDKTQLLAMSMSEAWTLGLLGYSRERDNNI